MNWLFGSNPLAKKRAKLGGLKRSTTAQLRQNVDILAPDTAVDGYNNPKNDFTEVQAGQWARVETVAGSAEFVRIAQQFAPDATHVVTMRSDTVTRTIKATNWLNWNKWDGTTVLMQIRYIDPGEHRQEGIIIFCKEYVGLTANIV